MQDAAKQHAFQRSAFISKLPPALQNHLFTIAEDVHLTTGQYLHRKSDGFNGLFCLLSGRLKATGVTTEGVEYSLAHVTPGAVIGEVAYLDGGTRTHDAIAIEPSHLARITKQGLDDTCAHFPEFYGAIVQLACLHIRQSFAVVDDFLTLSPEQRLAKKLLALSTVHDGTLAVDINQQECAAWIGISRQSINKILNRWQRAGWISIAYGRVDIQQPAPLRALYSA